MANVEDVTRRGLAMMGAWLSVIGTNRVDREVRAPVIL
jgi:hypothetical protein